MEVFKASVQYDDLKGGVAADTADQNDADSWLLANGHINQKEHVMGISMWAGENHGTHNDPVSVRFLVSDLNGYETIPAMLEAEGDNIQLREIRVDMNIVDFMALFKRFEVTLSRGGDFEGHGFRTL